MSGILGNYGTLVWRFFPESREIVNSLISEELVRAIDEERLPTEISVFEYTIHAVFPIVERLDDAASSGDLVQRFCQFCRALLAYAGPDAMDVDYHFNITLLEYADVPRAAAAARAVDPDLVDLIRANYGKWK
ncbi:hypothetical protein [Paractinoplanes rishiriensis]|uniref:Uncharacterized protein n=1 Tax=Paractinoplanes rishiriensis TaxID=1050105 RepID=A0A919KBW3_9ACTN|nr:hypothetical protein [Actinoplanes rishiriensis]GIF02439.1 hypothetical protein Ari01nite_99030 [Actinoplanes rishiriensis]